jgi:uncharacterized membrane protein YesL
MAGGFISRNSTVLRQAFRSSYEQLGLTITISVIWFLAAAIPAAYMLYFILVVMAGGKLNILLPLILFWLTVTFLYGPVTAMAYAIAGDMINAAEIAPSSLWRAFTRHYKAAAAVTGAMAVILIILAVDVVVYLQNPTTLNVFLTIFLLYLMVFWFLMSAYIYPLITYKYGSVWQTLKQAALLTLDNMALTLLVAVEVLVVGLACIFFILPVPAYLGGTVALLHTAAFKAILTKYEKKPQPAD